MIGQKETIEINTEGKNVGTSVEYVCEAKNGAGTVTQSTFYFVPGNSVVSFNFECKSNTIKEN